MRKYSGDCDATRALHIHEVAVRALNEALELVLASLSRSIRMKKICLELEVA
jgi:hypothetical protein